MYNSIDAKSNDIKSNYHLLISGIVPRPIAIVGTRSKDLIIKDMRFPTMRM